MKKASTELFSNGIARAENDLSTSGSSITSEVITLGITSFVQFLFKSYIIFKYLETKNQMKTKQEKIAQYNAIAPKRDFWRKKNVYYYEQLEKLFRFLVPEDSKVLELGCGTGELLQSVKPSYGVGIDFSEEMIRLARQRFPELTFKVEDAEDLSENEVFDYVIMSDILGELSDINQAFVELHKVTNESSRIVITNFNHLWEPVMRAGEHLGMKMPQDLQNWLSLDDIENLLYLNGFEVIKTGYRLMLPKNIPGISYLFNRFLAIMPFFKKLCLMEYVVAKPIYHPCTPSDKKYSVSVVIPCRNEQGNIEAAVERTPDMGAHTEILFIDGNSTDGTVEKIEEMIEKYKGQKDIKLMHQIPKDTQDNTHLADTKTPPNKMLKLGKGDAVRKAFDAATGDILMILDADLTVPPEDLPKFYSAISTGRGEFINGTRLVFQMEKEAMRTLNILGNKFFSLVFTWLLEQPIKDTLCGTKVMFKMDYERIKKNRSFFGDFDPFGDFDLLFGASKLALKIVEMPIHYKERTYGDIKIERFKHGLLLLKMSYIAFKKLKLL